MKEIYTVDLENHQETINTIKEELASLVDKFSRETMIRGKKLTDEME